MIKINFDKIIGKIKPMNAVNNGPTKEVVTDQVRNNFLNYKALGVPYARNHDASFCSAYGGEHTVDVHLIFNNFDADENDENNYDFFYTDKYIENLLKAGTETYYRLGSKIEHGPKKYGTLKPKDPLKWAKICEHIIAHYNEGWANGFNYNIKYWEIWNEPDLSWFKAPELRPNWSGTKEEFFEFFIIAAKYLKNRFPQLKIGGPAVSWMSEWVEEFLQAISKENVRIDFFSWHRYAENPYTIIKMGKEVRELLNKYGYTNVESHCNEWNYVESWTDGFVQTIRDIISERGASFTASVMNLGQVNDIDMLMYYDARLNTCFNGMFDFYSLSPLKGYYPFYVWNIISKLENCVEVESSDERITATAAIKDGKAGITLSFFDVDRDNETEEEINISLNGLTVQKGELYLTDKNHTFEKVGEISSERFTIKLQPSSVLFISINNLEI